MSVSIRVVETGELSAVARLDAEVFAHSASVEAYPLFVLRQFYDLFPSHLLVAVEAGRLIGYVAGGVAVPGAVGWVLTLAVAADRRRSGTGRTLMTELLGRFEESEVVEARLAVEPDNRAAIALYEQPPELTYRGVWGVGGKVYALGVTKRTNINLDTELLWEAAELLGTQRITDTVHAAMREVVDREYRRRLANRRLFDDVTSEEFEAMRRGRNLEG